jgi:hypothetical protein
MIKKRKAIKTLRNLQEELDTVNDLNQEEHWRNMAISHLTKFIGADNQITTSLGNFRMSKPIDKAEVSSYTGRVIQVSYDVFDPLKKYDAMEIVDNAITYISVHGILTPTVKYDNPFEGMTLKAHCWLWGGLVVGASTLIPLTYHLGKSQGEDISKDQAYQLEQLKDSIRIANAIESVRPVISNSLLEATEVNELPKAKKVKRREHFGGKDSLQSKF